MDIVIGLEHAQFSEILSLYESVGWTAYTKDPESLMKALKHSSLVVIIKADQKVIGLARSLSDEVSIHYIQDILVNPDFQGKGVGRKLLETCLAKYQQVRTHMILTDNEAKQIHFYESMGFKNTKSLAEHPLNAFVKMNGIELS